MFKPTNADDVALTLNPINMKTIIKVFAGLFLLAVMYFVVADGMMVHLGLSQAIQFAYNFGAILVLIPFSLFIIIEEKVA